MEMEIWKTNANKFINTLLGLRTNNNTFSSCYRFLTSTQSTNLQTVDRPSAHENLKKDAPSVKSRHFCLKHMTYQNHGISVANVTLCLVISRKHLSHWGARRMARAPQLSCKHCTAIQFVLGERFKESWLFSK